MEQPYYYEPIEEMVSSKHSIQSISAKEIKGKFQSGAYQQIEATIIKALHKYRILNKYVLSRYLTLILKDAGRDNYDSILHTLYEEGVLTKQIYKNITYYELSDAALQYASTKYKEKPYIELDTPTRLEIASTAQWHISLLAAGYRGRDLFYSTSDGIPVMPSLYSFKKGKLSYKVYSLPIPKTEEHLKATWKMLEQIAEIKADNRSSLHITKQVMVTVLCGSTLTEIENMAKILARLDAFRHMKFYFVLDANTKDSIGLEKLYTLEENREESRLITLSIK